MEVFALDENLVDEISAQPGQLIHIILLHTVIYYMYSVGDFIIFLPRLTCIVRDHIYDIKRS